MTTLNSKKRCRPLYSSYIAAGFPSPADDYIETTLDLNEHLIKRPSSTFYVRALGESMIEAGILDGSLLIVDKSLEAQNGKIVLASLSGEFTLKEFRKRQGQITLVPRNPNFKTITVTEDMDFSLWGVVTHCILDLQ